MTIKEIKDVSYGPYERNKLDAYIVQTEQPSPVLIFFHGGGYTTGDKDVFQTKNVMHDCLKAHISVVTCNYRFITENPYPAPMLDGTRAIQFVRSKAKEWGIDPEKIATAGSSAGGHIALWNALQGNLANDDSSDPIERVSSNVVGFIGYGTQVSKDQRFYAEIYNGPHVQPNLPLFYGARTVTDLQRPEYLEIAEEASAINYMSEDAPPAFMTYDYPLEGEKIPKDAPVGEVIHHPMHGYILKQAYDKYNIPFVLRHTKNPVQPSEMIHFLQNCFKRVEDSTTKK